MTLATDTYNIWRLTSGDIEAGIKIQSCYFFPGRCC